MASKLKQTVNFRACFTQINFLACAKLKTTVNFLGHASLNKFPGIIQIIQMILGVLDVESGLTRHGGGSGVLGESGERGIKLLLFLGDRALSYQ